ncbi:MAG: hypothetical protein GXP00_09135 [Alphaproteobacteria bacterium]|nr:hypothetical protein [Alphaproteobacteria bacterium]
MSDPAHLSRRQPLYGRSIIHNGLQILPVPEVGKIMLQRSNRVHDDDMTDFGEAFAQAFGPELPLQVNSTIVSKDGAITLLCTGPNTWMILCDDPDAMTIAGWIEATAGDRTITAAIMTDQYICLDIRGEHARALLAKGCALNLDAQVFTEGHCARTLLAQANMVLWPMGTEGFRIFFDVSFSEYLWYWLESVSEEYAEHNG